MKRSFKKVIALFLCMTLIFSLAACQTEKSSTIYKAGTYSASANGKNGPINVEVVFTDDKIESIKILGQNETSGISDEAIEKLPDKIISDQSLAVDGISGATVSSNAILAAVEDCVKQAGGNPEDLKKKIETANVAKTEEASYDIVVIGAGAAGTAAALSASEKSKSVLLLEKTAKPMGAGTLAGGLFAAESSLQKEAGKTVSKEWLYDEYMKSSSGYMNSLLVRTIIEESSETVDWLIKNGCELSLVDAGTGGSYTHIGMPSTLHGYKEGGIVAITKLIESFKKNGGTVMFSTPATELVKDENGKVTGVMARKEDGTTLKANAKAVIIATGGFGGNEEMLKEIFGDDYTVGEVTTNVGDGIKMAWDAGADKYGETATHYFWQTFPRDKMKELTDAVGMDYFDLTNFTFYPHLRVNTLGQRFSDETMASDFAIHGAQIHMQPEQTEFIILDTGVLNQIAQKGFVSIEDHYGKWKNDRQFYMEFNEPNDTDELIARENTPTDLTPLLKEAAGTGVVYSGNTLEELANNMGVNPNTFAASVGQYNDAIKSGRDDMFFADAARLIPVAEGPYYAIKFVTRNLSTLGGVRINEKIEAVDHNRNAIPGLYVAGADAGGMYGQTYVDFEGGTLGFAYTSGRLAGKNAADYINK